MTCGEVLIERPDTRFATASDGTHVAYQVLGDGPAHLLYVPAWISHVELNWGDQTRAAFLRRLANEATVTVIDKRGTGLSARLESVPDLEDLVEDIRAVMDASGIERAVLFGVSSGAGMSALFAAAYPNRARGLVMYAPKARARWARDYPWGMRSEEFEKELTLIRDEWDSGEFVRSYAAPIFAPGRVGKDELMVRMVRYTHKACSIEDAIALSEMWWEIDYRSILPSICTPTLVLCPPRVAEESAYVAQRIPGARQETIPDAGSRGWLGESGLVADTIHDFVGEVGDEEADSNRVLVTVLFTDIVDSTKYATAMGDRTWIATRDEHDQAVRSHLARFRGHEVKTMGDGFLATFDGPARAIRCSLALCEAVQRLGIEIRAGLHTGEVALTDGDVSGINVVIGARVMAAAGPSEVLVTQTVRDLVAGSDLAFEEVGVRELKGIPGHRLLYRAFRDSRRRPSGLD